MYPYLTKQISSVMAILMGDQPWGLHTHYRNQPLCAMCSDRILDTPEHILFECNRLDELRSHHVSKVIGLMPVALKRDFMEFDIRQKTSLFISGYYCESIIGDWTQMFCATACFIHDMYVKRKLLLSET